MVDCDAQEDKSNQEAAEQRAAALPMFDRDTFLAIRNMDVVFDHATQSARCRITERLESAD